VDGHGALDAYAANASGPMDLGQSNGGLKAPKNGSTVSLAPTGPVDTWNVGLWSGTSWDQEPNSGWAWNGLGWNGPDWNGWAWNRCGLPLLDSCTWNGWAWNGAQWSSSWSGSAWDGTAWNGSVWNGAAWGSVDTNGRAWNGG
jgi:hypothetical protein